MKQNKLIFTPGPVKEFPETNAIGGQQTPYFRNDEFSQVMLESEKMLLALVNAPQNSKVITLTASGTAAMEAAVLNLVSVEDKTLSIVSGGFGQRFSDICKIHQRECQSYHPQQDDDLTNTDVLLPHKDNDILLINAHETTICHQFNLTQIGQFCKKNDLLHIVDGISAFLTDPLDMQLHNIDALIVSSQKGLALPPGLAMIILTPKAIDKIIPEPATLYFKFSDYLTNAQRGQTPYTPAVSIILQMHQRLKSIIKQGGIDSAISHTQSIAQFFRNGIKNLPLALYSKHMPNSVTALITTNGQHAGELVADIESKYQIVLCPNGGALSKTVFRVSHMGNITREDTQKLLNVLHDYYGINV
ncbi:pyridoxal-phosphate-dependent aminotransferase family protein [Pseudoalteromonas denitrificans]|uniref:Aspartate aminotransferase n=1 Tax=Pseudoalteromonas denitrificans DSM 6059 TaxID=1123010 RepID=A0A1I1KUL7_9GAMM|nr:aminotransferase class V-fold PLP-dependent enzyme [Pseudoalteromonas denitrificans]SFC64496.1 aspartate aminotransferase [Pseudoalteromonas denitrificans DSM 6059]